MNPRILLYHLIEERSSTINNITCWVCFSNHSQVTFANKRLPTHDILYQGRISEMPERYKNMFAEHLVQYKDSGIKTRCVIFKKKS